MRFLRFFALFGLFSLLVLAPGCSAQSATTDVKQRVERHVRLKLGVPNEVQVAVGERRPSEFAGYDWVTVTLSRGSRTLKQEYLLSKDGNTLVRFDKIDVANDPYVETMKKMNLEGRPVRGNKDAKVTIVNYDDFQCPFCARNHQMLFSDVIKTYGDRVRIIYKDYPLAEIHPWATRASINANCLAEQSNDAYWDFADYVHMGQKEITGPPLPQGLPGEKAKAESERQVKQQFERLDRAAEDAGRKRGVDAGKLAACIKTQKDDGVRASIREAEALGVSATPTMFVNGQKLDGAVPLEQFRAALDRALADAGQPAVAASKPDSKAVTRQ